MGDTDELSRQLHENRAQARRLAGSLSHHQFNWRPGTDRWSVAECIQHLNITEYMVLKVLRPVIDEALARGMTGTGPFHYGWFSRWFEAQMEPPPRRTFKAPTAFAVAPGSSWDRDKTLADFAAVGGKLDECLELSRTLDLRRIKVPSAAMPLLRLPLGATFRVQTAHERRHLWQAEQVVKDARFPRA